MRVTLHNFKDLGQKVVAKIVFELGKFVSFCLDARLVHFINTINSCQLDCQLDTVNVNQTN